MLRHFILFSLLAMLGACATGYDSLVQTYNAPRKLIWKAMVRVLAKEYIGFSKVVNKPPTLVTKPKMLDKEFGVDKTAYVATATLTGFSRPYAVDVVVKRYPDIVSKPNVFTIDLDKAAEVLENIRKFIDQERFNFSIKDQFTPY